jgi:hypothetical protein
MGIAVQLLEVTDLRLAEIAPRVGYRSEFFVQPGLQVGSRRLADSVPPRSAESFIPWDTFAQSVPCPFFWGNYRRDSRDPVDDDPQEQGLKYHSVIFVGLDDGAWWSFAGDQIEATAGFFVAFTRQTACRLYLLRTQGRANEDRYPVRSSQLPRPQDGWQRSRCPTAPLAVFVQVASPTKIRSLPSFNRADSIDSPNRLHGRTG